MHGSNVRFVQEPINARQRRRLILVIEFENAACVGGNAAHGMCDGERGVQVIGDGNHTVNLVPGCAGDVSE